MVQVGVTVEMAAAPGGVVRSVSDSRAPRSSRTGGLPLAPWRRSVGERLGEEVLRAEGTEQGTEEPVGNRSGRGVQVRPGRAVRLLVGVLAIRERTGEGPFSRVSAAALQSGDPDGDQPVAELAGLFSREPCDSEHPAGQADGSCIEQCLLSPFDSPGLSDSRLE